MHEASIGRTYLRELMSALGIYLVLLTIAIVLSHRLEHGALRTLAVASPMIGFGLAVWAIARHLRRVDEFIRMRVLENIAIAAAVTASVSFTYGFLELTGFPQVSMFSVWGVMGASWLAVHAVRQFADR